MPISRRNVCAGALAMAPAAHAEESALPALVRLSETSNDVLMRGDIVRYRELITLTDDFVLMAPVGGKPSGPPKTEAAWAALGRFFANGFVTHELVHAWEVADMAVLAVIERGRGEVGGLPAQDWALRVTLVYRRTSEGWALAHRHADPLAHGVTLQQSAALGRGEGAPS